jgi:MerR family redox-sensitive transcriptional activator SoxR
MPKLADAITIGELAGRSGVATSALRFYESLGLIAAERTPGNQRRYARAMLRRVAFIRAAREIGLSLEDVATALATLPTGKTPTKADWQRLSNGWQRHLDERIQKLERLRTALTGCIGCGCLSLRTCRIFNPDDEVSGDGAGARLLYEE